MQAVNVLPVAIATLVNDLQSIPGVVAVALGGSRALGNSTSDSDWDIGVYYRVALDLSVLSARGEVHPPGSWGRLMNGGAWLRCDGHRVDVLLRDLDVVEHWFGRAQDGDFEVDALLGYVAGAPTYLLAAELASCRLLYGAIPQATYPEKLAAMGAPRWRFCRSFSMAYARAQAERGNVVGAVAQASKAAMEEGHAILCERREWICNEKRLLDAAGLSDLQPLFTQVPAERAQLLVWIDRLAERLGIPRDSAAPWQSG